MAGFDPSIILCNFTLQKQTPHADHVNHANLTL